MFLVHISVSTCYVLFVKFRCFPEVWGNPEIQDADPTWPPFDNLDVITTQYDVITSRCGPQRKHLWTYYLSSKSRRDSFYTCEVMEGRRIRPPPRPQKTKRSKQLSMKELVNCFQPFTGNILLCLIFHIQR